MLRLMKLILKVVIDVVIAYLIAKNGEQDNSLIDLLRRLKNLLVDPA